MNRAELQRYGYSIQALRLEARKRLPRMIFDMVDGAAGDEITVKRNEADIAALQFIPKVLAGAGTRSQSVELFGHRLPSPVIVAPTGLAGLLWPHAELAAARAAARFGTIYTTSHASTSTMEEIAAETRGPKWMQVFLYKDRGLTAEFIGRAKAAGYEGLVLTVDNQVMAVRDRDARNGLMFPMKLRTRGLLDLASHPAWLLRMRKAPNPTFVNYGTRTSIGAFGPVMAEQLDPDIGWKDVEWVRSLWQGPMILKGLLDPQEAREAQARGIDAVIVSNHGGRQLDGTISGIRALPAIVDAVGDKTVVLVDGGFRRGADVVKALALGARAVLIGRPQLWGVACGGEEGVHWVLEIFAREIDRALALGGWDGIDKLNRSIFAAP
jgi:L-lactate dehydrogenase (cytochrome)/(S)-mandelate dehydrogenase